MNRSVGFAPAIDCKNCMFVFYAHRQNLLLYYIRSHLNVIADVVQYTRNGLLCAVLNQLVFLRVLSDDSDICLTD